MAEEISVSAPKERASKRWQHFENRMDQLRVLGLDCDPIQVLMEVAVGQLLDKKTGQLRDMLPAPDPKDRAKAAAELCSYLYPKLKSVEVSGADGQPISFIVSQDLTPLPVLPGQDQLVGGDLNEGPLLEADFDGASAESRDE